MLQIDCIELMLVLEKGKQLDIYCFDILMSSFTGIELAKEIRLVDNDVQIIFYHLF